MSEKACNADEDPCGEAEKRHRIIGKSRRDIKPHQGQRHPRCAAPRTLQPRDLPKQARDPKRRMQDQKRIKHSHAENRPVYNQYFFLHRIGKSSPHRALCTGFRSAHILLLLSYVDAPHHVTETIITKPPPRLNPNLQNLRFHQKTPSNEDFANKTAPEPQPKSLQSRRWLLGSSAATFSEPTASSSPRIS